MSRAGASCRAHARSRPLHRLARTHNTLYIDDQPEIQSRSAFFVLPVCIRPRPRSTNGRSDGMSMRVMLVTCVLASSAFAAVENHGTKLGWRYLKEGDYARAERIFEQVLNQDPKDMKA